MPTKIYKFGGTSLGDAEKMVSAANALVCGVTRDEKIICVVSAMGKTTDELYAVVRKMDPRTSISASISVVGMGEIISARMLGYALKQAGVNVMCLEPFSGKWPILLKRDGSLSKRRTAKAVKEHLPSLLRRHDVIVVPGFIGVKPGGTWGTLGRGGSDTTAFIIGKYIKADEIIIVKDVNGIYDADPSIVPDAKQLQYIDADELSTMSALGAGVLHADALSYKGKGQKVKIIHHSFGDLAYGGTVVDGTVERSLYLLDEKLDLISFCKKDIAGERKLIGQLTKRIMEQTRVFGTTLGIDYLGFYVPSEASRRALASASRISMEHSIKLIERKDIALLIMRRESPVNLPGMIAYLLTPLSKEKVNVVEVITIGREILVFTQWKDRVRAMNILKRGTKKRD